MHLSVIQSGGKPAVARCTTCCSLFHCPLCPKVMFKPSQPSRLQRHLEVHMKNAITFEDKKICRCNLNCRNGGHFHCPICEKTLIKRTDMEGHLKAEEQQAEVSVRPANEDVDTSVEGDSVEARILQDCRHAAEWVEANNQMFSAKVDLPDVLFMGEEEQAKASMQYGRVWTEDIDEQEREQILEPLKFIFHDINDMWQFCDEIMDKRNKLASCECHKDD